MPSLLGLGEFDNYILKMLPVGMTCREFLMPADGSGETFAIFSALVRSRLDADATDVWDGDVKNLTFRLSVESAIHTMKAIARWRNRSGEFLDIHASFTDIIEPNAVADRHGPAHIVAMHTPLFVAISEFAMFCFTQPGFFDDVGDPGQESSPSPIDNNVPGLWLLEFTKGGGKVSDQHSEMLTPRDPTRYGMSLHLAQLMARFVWLHEYAHCYNGHVDFVQKTSRAFRLHEVGQRVSIVGFADKDGLRHIAIDADLQALELDADQAAFWASVQIQLTDRENLDRLAEVDRELRIRMALFGAYAMTFLFDAFQAYLDAQENVTHPAPYLRLHNLFRTAASHLADRYEGFSALNQKILEEFDTVAGAIPNIYRSDTLAKDADDAELQRRLTAMTDRLEALRPELDQYRYGPPSDDDLSD